ncbi:MAG: aminomethyl-transferring glycine dehydrogenase subunit GcvPB [Candidatus Thorarchaeota archaeon]
MNTSRETGYQAVIWKEPIIYELGEKGRRGILPLKASDEIRRMVGDVLSLIPDRMKREELPPLPELSEPEVVRHFIHLSQQTFGTDSGINAGLGTCTMKYNPKINESIARSPKLSHLHPLQDIATVQGILEIMFKLQTWLCEISGMDSFSFQPRGGAHAVFTNALIMKAYHSEKGELERRNEIITSVLSHPCNASAPSVAGFKIITLYPDETGVPDIEALKAAVSENTAGMMLTNPYDTGIFDENIEEYIAIVHEYGGLVAIDQANVNPLFGQIRVGDIGADLCHFNLHKSFSTPHGSCGPGSAPIGVKESLSKYLPIPVIAFDGNEYALEYDRPYSIGKIGEFHGVVSNIVRAYAWLLSIGVDGLKEVSEISVINNNYLTQKLLEIRGISLPWHESHPYRLHESRLSLMEMYDDTGVGIADFNRRIVDFGVQRFFTSHEPWLVREPLTPEPTESISKEDLDRFVEICRTISKEAYSNPEMIMSAPHNCSVAKVVEDGLSNSGKWATTWRAFCRKEGRL